MSFLVKLYFFSNTHYSNKFNKRETHCEQVFEFFVARKNQFSSNINEFFLIE